MNTRIAHPRIQPSRAKKRKAAAVESEGHLRSQEGQRALFTGSNNRPLGQPVEINAPSTKRPRILRTDVRPVSRRSARLQARQHISDIGSPLRTAPSALPRDPQNSLGAARITLPSKGAKLSKRNLQLHDKMTKRSIPKKGPGSVATSKTKLTIETSKTTETKRSISTTSSGFEERAIENGVLNRVDSVAPSNLEARFNRLNEDRTSAEPPETEWKRYVYDVETAPNEATLLSATRKLLKEYPEDLGYRQVLNQAFTNFPDNVGFNDGLSAPQPDLIEGLNLPQFKPFPVKDQLGGAAVLVKNDPFSVTLPHLAGECKARGKDMNEARLQSAYDGAALVYGRNQALSYLGKPDPANQANITTFITDGSCLRFSSHHSSHSESNAQLLYHQYPLVTTGMTDSYNDWKRGRRQLRNAQDDARKASHALKDQLNARWKTVHTAESMGKNPGKFPAQRQSVLGPGLAAHPDGVDGSEAPYKIDESTPHQRGSSVLPQNNTCDIADEDFDVVDGQAYGPTPPASSNPDKDESRAKQ